MSEISLFQKIAICDDEKSSLEYIQKYIEDFFRQYGIPFTTAVFQSAEKMLESLKETVYDICFLDIDMPGMNGLRLAEQIRKRWQQVQIIFVSGKEEYVFQSFQVHPFSFVRKSCFKKDMKTTIEDLMKWKQKEQQKNTDQCRLVDEAGYEHVFCTNSICYLMAEGKYVNVVLSDGRKLIRSSMKNLEKELISYGMVRCHKSYIVNIQKVYAVKHDHLVMLDQTELPIRRGMVTELKKRLCSVLVQ